MQRDLQDNEIVVPSDMRNLHICQQTQLDRPAFATVVLAVVVGVVVPVALVLEEVGVALVDLLGVGGVLGLVQLLGVDKSDVELGLDAVVAFQVGPDLGRWCGGCVGGKEVVKEGNEVGLGWVWTCVTWTWTKVNVEAEKGRVVHGVVC